LKYLRVIKSTSKIKITQNLQVCTLLLNIYWMTNFNTSLKMVLLHVLVIRNSNNIKNIMKVNNWNLTNMSVWPSLLFFLSISVGLLFNHHLHKDPNNNFKRLRNGTKSYPETIKFKTTNKLIIIGLLHQLVILF